MATRLAKIRAWQDGQQIPAGWRLVGDDEQIKVGDRYCVNAGAGDEWIAVRKSDSRVGMRCYPDCFVAHITRISA